MRGFSLFVLFIMLLPAMMGCMDSSDDPDVIEIIDEHGNHILKQGDGNRYAVGVRGDRIFLDGRIPSFEPVTVDAGEVSILNFGGSGTCAIVLPEFAFAVINGRIANDSIVSHDLATPFSLIVAPLLNISDQRTVVQISMFGKERTDLAMPIAYSDDPLDPIMSGQYWYDLEEHVTDDTEGYNGRYVGEGSPQLERAAVYFQGLFEGYGLEAHIERYPISTDSDVQVINVVAYHWGENRDEWIVIGGHYDVAPPPSYLGTWEGAYDNTAGTCAVMSLARGISQFETNKTIVFGLWSSEEEGLHGSGEFVDNLPPEVTVHANINLDMIGLAYPSPEKKLQGMTFPNENGSATEHPHFFWYMNHTIHDVLGLPRDIEIFHVREGGSSGSDHTPFYQAGIPAVFYHSGPVSQYHTPADTLENMINDAGSLELLIAGFDTALWIAFFTTIFLDGDGYVHP
jgi:hypothetical protein